MSSISRKKDLKRPLSLSEFAASHIRKAILKGELKPNSRIQQHTLAAELGLSHVPLREAIQKLVAEDFLVYRPRKGAFVMPITEDDVEEIFRLRLILETDAFRNSVSNLKSKQIKELENICRRADRTTDTLKYGELNRQFHLLLYSGVNRPRQLNFLKSLWQSSSRYSALLRIEGNHFEQSQKEHKNILEKISVSDVKGAGEILEHHINSARKEIIRIMKKNINDY